MGSHEYSWVLMSTHEFSVGTQTVRFWVLRGFSDRHPTSGHVLSTGKQKELFESGPPFPTRQLPIYAEQLKNSPATRIYKKEKFQAWLTPWCPPPFGAWNALAVAKASFVGFGPFVRHFASAYSPF